jgi:hypothetical protein
MLILPTWPHSSDIYSTALQVLISGCVGEPAIDMAQRVTAPKA